MSPISQKRPYVHNRSHLIMGFGFHACPVHRAVSSAFSGKEFLSHDVLFLPLRPTLESKCQHFVGRVLGQKPKRLSNAWF